MSEAKVPAAPSGGLSVNTGVQVGGPAPSHNSGIYIGGNVSGGVIAVGDNVSVTQTVHANGTSTSATTIDQPRSVGQQSQSPEPDRITATTPGGRTISGASIGPSASHENTGIQGNGAESTFVVGNVQNSFQSPQLTSAQALGQGQQPYAQPDQVTATTPGGRNITGVRLDPPQAATQPTLGEAIRNAVGKAIGKVLGVDNSPQGQATSPQGRDMAAAHRPPQTPPAAAQETYRSVGSLAAATLADVRAAVGTMQGTMQGAPSQGASQTAPSQTAPSRSTGQGVSVGNNGVVVDGNFSGSLAVGKNATAMSAGGGSAIAVGTNATAVSVNSPSHGQTAQQPSPSQGSGQNLPMTSVKGMGGGTITGVDLSQYSSSSYSPSRPPSTPNPGGAAGPAKGSGQSR